MVTIATEVMPGTRRIISTSHGRPVIVSCSASGKVASVSSSTTRTIAEKSSGPRM